MFSQLIKHSFPFPSPPALGHTFLLSVSTHLTTLDELQRIRIIQIHLSVIGLFHLA